MLRHKLIDRVCCVILALTLLVSALFVGAAATGRIAEDRTIGYETRLFDQSRVHTIDIVMEDWDAFLQTCTSEVYASCHLVIDGESYKNVGIRGKGNTSLSSVAAYGNNRYSFKVEFDQYQNGLTYYGLDKLSLNNLIQDNTYMKDYFAYTLMNKMGVAAPLCSFVQINVNGEPWGLYLAVEGVEDAFLQRNYGKNYGELYKPDSLSFGGGRGNGEDFDMGDFDFSFGGEDEGGSSMPEAPQMPSGGDDSFGGSAGGSSGDRAGGQASTPEPTATATPETTATPAPTAAPAGDDSFGGSAGDAASNGDATSTGDATSSGMPAGSDIPTMPDGAMPAGSDIPVMPDGAMPDMGSIPAEIPGSSGESATQAPAADASSISAMPDMGSIPAEIPGSSGESATQAPAADASSIPAMSGGTMPDMGNPPADFDFSQMGDFKMPDMGGGFGGFGSSTDVKLQYAGDDPSSYTNIFNNAKTDITTADQTRLIASIKALNEGDVSVVNQDAVIRYMAVHNFLCNDDSYTGMMVHNYYLYEENGVLEMIPWDYNLAYGGFSGSMGGATSTVNTSISRLVSMGSDSDRPMAGWITASEEYTAQYLAIYQEFMATAFDSGWFAEEIDRVRAMIAPYVQADPTAFCTYEEFQVGADTLKAFCLKRAESVNNQLKGNNAQVNASELDLSVMGTMNNGGGFGGGPSGFDRSDRNNDRKQRQDAPAATDAPVEEAAPAPQKEQEANTRPDFGGMFEMSNTARQSRNVEAWVLLAVCAALLIAALVFAGCYRSKR